MQPEKLSLTVRPLAVGLTELLLDELLPPLPMSGVVRILSALVEACFFLAEYVQTMSWSPSTCQLTIPA